MAQTEILLYLVAHSHVVCLSLRRVCIFLMVAECSGMGGEVRREGMGKIKRCLETS